MEGVTTTRRKADMSCHYHHHRRRAVVDVMSVPLFLIRIKQSDIYLLFRALPRSTINTIPPKSLLYILRTTVYQYVPWYICISQY